MHPSASHRLPSGSTQSDADFLIVHPYLNDRRNLETLLRDLGYKSQTVFDTAGEGLRFLQEEDPDVIIFPRYLEAMDGYQFAKKASRMTSSPLVVVCSNINESDLLRLLDVGVDECWLEPFRRERISDRLERLLMRTARSTTNSSSA